MMIHDKTIEETIKVIEAFAATISNFEDPDDFANEEPMEESEYTLDGKELTN